MHYVRVKQLTMHTKMASTGVAVHYPMLNPKPQCRSVENFQVQTGDISIMVIKRSRV